MGNRSTRGFASERDRRIAADRSTREMSSSRRRLLDTNERIKINTLRAEARALQSASDLNRSPRHDPHRRVDLDRWPRTKDPRRGRDTVDADLRRKILDMDPVCVWCQRRASSTLDHVWPLKRGGGNSLLNLVGSCEQCNVAKADFMPAELGWVLHLPRRAFHLGAPADRHGSNLAIE